jgi:hypothetical protein
LSSYPAGVKGEGLKKKSNLGGMALRKTLMGLGPAV